MSAIYERAREHFLKGEISWTSDCIKICLLDSSYPGGNTSLFNDEFYSDIAAYVLAGTETAIVLGSKTTHTTVPLGTAGGIAGAADVTFHAVTVGFSVGYFVLFKDANPAAGNGVPASPTTSPLILLVDGGYGIGLNTNNGDIKVTFDPTLKIYKL